MSEIKRTKIPNISKERIDFMPTETIINKEKNIKINDFLKNKEATHALTLRMPKSLYLKLRKKAFQKNVTMTNLILKAINSENN